MHKSKMVKGEVLKFQAEVPLPPGYSVEQSVTHMTDTIVHSGVKRSFDLRKKTITNPGFDQKHAFTLNRTEGSVSDLIIQFISTDGGTTASADQQAPNYIKQIDTRLDGDLIDCYKGEVIPILLRHLNWQDTVFNEIYAVSGGDGSDPPSLDNATRIHAPGSDLTVGTSSHPVNLKNLDQDMCIEVTLRSGADAYTTLGGGTITSMVLWYKSWDVEVPQTNTSVFPHTLIRTNNQGKGTGTTGEAYTADTLGPLIDLDSLFKTNEVKELIIAVTTDGSDATKDRVQTVGLSKIILTINSQEVYRHDTLLEGRMKFMSVFGHPNTRTINSNVTHYYSIPLGNFNPKAVHDIRNQVQEFGLKLKSANVELQIAPTTTDSFIYNFSTLSRRSIRLSPGKVEKLE